MHFENFAQSLIVLIAFVESIVHVVCEEKITTFYVQPGGETHTFKDTLGDFTCTFTYSAQGGTNEEWAMALNKVTDFTCDVLRPEKDTYLMFENYELKIEGAKLHDAVVFSDKINEAPSTEYVKDFKTSSVKNSKQFQGKMQRVIAIASNKKEDL